MGSDVGSEPVRTYDETMKDPVLLTPSEYERAGRVLGRAFCDDPQWSALLPDNDIRADRLSMMFTGTARMTAAARGLPERTAGFEAIALWLAPGREIGFTAMLRSGFSSARWLYKRPRQNVGRFMRVLRQFDSRRKQLMKDPHWYLMAIGVDPEHQRGGHGSTLVGAGIARADRDQKPIYLETETELNVDFYQRLGFEVLDEMVIDEIGIPFSLLIRRPSG